MIERWLSIDEVPVALALVAVAVGMISALSCAVLGQLADDPRGLWLCAGITLYSAIGIPAATLISHSSVAEEAAIGNVRLLAHAMFVALTFAAVFVKVRPSMDGWLVLFIGLSMSGAAATIGVALPEGSLAVTTNQTVRFTLCALWLASAVCIIRIAGAPRRSWLFWAGLGCLVIAVAHTLRAAAGSPLTPVGLSFSTIRLVGVGVLLAAVAPAARRALTNVHIAHTAQAAELKHARNSLQEVAERDHEIRSGLSALTSATALLDADGRRAEDSEALREAVAAEMARLNALLHPRGADGTECSAQEYDILSVLQQRVVLMASTGMDIRVVEVSPGLRAHGNPMVVAQVLANLLNNCARHAEGSPVRIQAIRRGRMVVLRIQDFGPGVAAGQESSVFDRGARARYSAGQGLGLYLARRLIEGESGRIFVQPRPANGAGCTVVIELPAAVAPCSDSARSPACHEPQHSSPTTDGAAAMTSIFRRRRQIAGTS
ncbi:MAG: sensor histidine kinase [Pseudonocardia sp.]